MKSMLLRFRVPVVCLVFNEPLKTFFVARRWVSSHICCVDISIGDFMKIHDDHMYHGSALIQIAEHKQFTAINAFTGKLAKYENVYEINKDIAVYLKYATSPTKAYSEYHFTFNKSNLAELEAIDKAVSKVYLALVCVTAREVCSLPYEQLLSLIALRRNAAGHAENQYTILVTVKPGESMHVYVNYPNKKKTVIGKHLVINRNAFPNDLFA
jgi:hypothetical protein